MRSLGSVVRVVTLLLLLLASARSAMAQDPVRLPGVQVTADRPPPGPKLLVGVVRDTLGVIIDGVEVSIAKLERRTASKDDGTFRFTDVPRGKVLVRARKFGYAPQVREADVGAEGGVVEFALLPMARSLPPVITSAAAGGLSGVVGDTSYQAVAGAVVHLNAKARHAVTDSTGAFFIDAPPGSYMVSITKDGYKKKVVSVRIPEDSGRRMSVIVTPFTGKVPVREAWNIEDMRSRLSWRSQLTDVMYTRDEILALGFEWAPEVMREGGQALYDRDCSAVLNGGPASVRLNTLTTDELEAMEIYQSARGGGRPNVRPRETPGGNRTAPRKRVADSRLAAPALTNTKEASFDNLGKFCPVVYVWLR